MMILREGLPLYLILKYQNIKTKSTFFVIHISKAFNLQPIDSDRDSGPYSTMKEYVGLYP